MKTAQLIISFLLFIHFVSAQPVQPNGVDSNELQPVQPDSATFKKREKSQCDREFRTLDGTCTSFGSPLKKLWASTNRPHFTYFVGRDTVLPRDLGLPSTRMISNALCRQSMDIFDPRGLSEMATFFGQFIDHTIVATTTNKAEPMPIKIPENDPIMANFSKGELPFFRSVRVRVSTRDNIQRASNTLSSVIDLASVYGPSKERSTFLRASSDGLLKTGAGNLLPLNTDRLNNAPRVGPDFFLAGDHRANEHPVLTALHTIFVREHNDIARELKKTFPQWGNEVLFETARKINGAQMQKIVFSEWYPAVTGRELPRYKGFKTNVDPTISLTFSTAGFRVGHTMVGNKVSRRGKGNSKLSPFTLKEMFFKSASALKTHGVEEFLRGALVNRAQEIDLQVHDSLRNFLFTRIDGEEGVDLIAMNLQRGRDHNLPSYNALRAKFDLPKAVSFSGITKNRNVQNALASVYPNAGFVEAWIGLVAENHAPESSMGETMLRLWRKEFTRFRDGDSFYYRAAGVFSDDLKKKVPRVQALFTSEDCFTGIILRNTDITEKELPQRLFFV